MTIGVAYHVSLVVRHEGWHISTTEGVEAYGAATTLLHTFLQHTSRSEQGKARQGDKVLLARHFMLKFAKEHDQKIKGFTPDAVQSIESYGWPGNIREMENKIKRAVIMADSKHITRDDLGLVTDGEDLSLNLRQVRQEAERHAILRAVAMTDNNISAAAKLLGITRPTFYDLIKKHDIPLGSNATT